MSKIVNYSFIGRCKVSDAKPVPFSFKKVKIAKSVVIPVRQDNKPRAVQLSDVKDFLNKLFDNADGKTTYSVSLLFNFGWRNGNWFNKKDQLRVYDPDVYYDDIENDDVSDKVYAIMIYSYKTPSTKGGNNKYNDCLFFAIEYAMPGAELPHPKKLKKWCKIGRTEKIDIDHIPIIEKKLKVNINVSGDHIYESPMTYNKTVNVALIKGHYEFKANDNKKLVDFMKFKKNPVAFFYINKNKDKVIYDGKETVIVSEHDSIKGKYYLLKSKTEQLKEEYEQHMKQVEALKEATEGFIDLNKTQCISFEAKRLFYYYSKSFNPEPMDEQEQRWIEKAFYGGLIWAEEGAEVRDGYVYDVNSQYPSIMSHPTFHIPMCKPTYHTLDELPTKIKCGIYHVKIYNTNKKLFAKIFKDYYTNTDIIRARELGLEIVLVKDGKPNAMIYEKTISGSTLFGDFVKYLYDLKKEHKLAKTILNSLWGSLCEKRSYNIYSKDLTSDDIDMPVSKLTEIIETKDDNYIFKCKSEKGVFKTDYARIGPFLTAKARALISRHIEPHIDHIKRVHTDGFLSDKPLDIPLSADLGKIKLEKSGHFIIKNVNKIISI